MAEYSAIAPQVVAANNNVLFTSTPICGGKYIQHREGSGLVTLRGITNQCRARYKVMFDGNVAAVTAAEPFSLAIAVDGEPLGEATMIVTPAAAADFFNVSAAVMVDVPACCCETISVRNTSTQALTVQNANLIVERVA